MIINLKVLMWKHLVVRVRRYFNTAFELLAPILFFILLFSLKDIFVDPPDPHGEKYNVQQTEPVEVNSMSSPITIFYYPATDFTKNIMENVKNYLTLYPSGHSFLNLKPTVAAIENITTIRKLSDENPDSAIVIFEIDDTETTPKKLRYSIRMDGDFKTYDFESSEEIDSKVSHTNYGVMYEPFMKLQWAIDSSYIQILTGTEIPQRIILQEFPYKRADRITIVMILYITLHYISLLSLKVVFVMIVARLTEERINGIQELIKMVGVSNNTLALSHVLNTLPTGLIFSIVPAILLTVTSVPIILYTNGFYIFLMLTLYFISIYSLACVCSHIPSNTQYTTSIAIFAYILLYVPCHFIIAQKYIKTWILPFAALLPHVPMSWFWLQVTFLDLSSGLSINSIAKWNFSKALPVLYCYFALIAQSIIFFAISWYLSCVKPGPYGQALPWNFLCQPQYWSAAKIAPEEEEELEELEEGQDPGYFEPPPKGVEVGIKIVNVSKTFGKQRALNNVSLDVYKGEITVLVGHNGAGKTTLMSIITGMFSATEGNVYIEGLDTVTQKGQMHQKLGLCPQHNLFFPELTVLEHVMFFAMLKNVPWFESRNSAIELLERLGLSDKIYYKSEQLSGGMKRRLQLACALAGDSHVLVLDEPTSGLDVETRRELWDLVLSLRGSRTVLLSTHFMEEAEALGDRVAALHAGRLRCFASPMHLKRTLGTGYRLSFTTNGMPNEAAITSIITSKIPEATVKEVSLNSISYNLPSKSSNKFPKLFNLLESKRYDLGINTIGVGVSTLEEVFLKLCSDVTTTFTDDMVDGGFVEPTFNTISGIPLYAHQLLVLLKRQFQYMWSKKISFLLLQIILPILFIMLFTHTSNNSAGDYDDNADKKVALNLNIYDKMDERRVLYDVGDTAFSMKSIENKYPDVTFERTNNVVQSVLQAGFKDLMEYNKYLAGIEFNGTDAKVLYTTVVRHAAPVALNMLSNVLAAQYTDGQITTYNHPLPKDKYMIYRSSDEDQVKGLAKSMLWIWSIIFIILVTTINAASLPCSERSSGTRHIHIMTGCPPPLHWIATLLGSTILYLLVLVIPTVIAPTILELDNTTNQPAFLGTYFLILVLGLITFLSVVYLISFNFKERVAGMLLVGYVIIFGLLTPALHETTEMLGANDNKDFSEVIVTLSRYTMPPHTLMNAGFEAITIARYNRMPDVEPKCYMCFDEEAPLATMFVLVAQFIFYMSLVILTEYGLFNSLFDRLFNVKYQPSTAVDMDEMVRAEKAYVDKAIALPPNQIQDVMLVNDVHKNYWRLFRKPCNAVKGISFSVKKGECFGLLGVNGAGKSTTFKMLTASECPTRGNIFANGYFMNKISGDYLRSLGYCPQFLGLDGFLTGHDNLALLLTLRGLKPRDVTTETKSWIETVGLEKYASRVASSYSGGCSRRLASAAALCRGGALTLLDEPTAGVDVAARRRVWAAVKRAQPHRSVVITSHSMDEMEALCGRIAIMSWGRIRALGEAAELRATHGAGHAVLLKLATRGQISDEPDGIKPEVNRLKAALQTKFNCTLKDEHTTRLHYHINDTVRYSELFSALEAIKEEFPDLLEDYSVTETTLEEVFLSFAKEEPRDGPTAV